MAGQKPIAFDALADLHVEKGDRPIFLRPNTFAHWDGEAFDVTLYETRIARLHNDDSVTVWSGGHHSATTKNRINDVLLPIGWELVQMNHNWHVRNKTTYRLRDFVEGMTMDKVNN